MKFLQLLSIIIFIFAAVFPTLIFGIECDVGGICYTRGYNGSTEINFKKTKMCKDACVRFKCVLLFDFLYRYMDGAGCYEDFVNVCSQVATIVKDKIKENIKNYSMRTKSLTFHSCSDKNRCAKSDLIDWAYNETIDGNMTIFDGKESCDYLDAPYPSVTINKCETQISCQTGFSYKKGYFSSKKFGADKECDACLNFKCTNDGGNTVIKGSGCWDDFVHACPTVPDDIKENIKKNIKDSFHADKNYVITSCSLHEKYAGRCGIHLYYETINFDMTRAFDRNINENYSELCTAEFLPTPTTQSMMQPDYDYYINGQTNVFKFHGILLIVIFGFALIYFS